MVMGQGVRRCSQGIRGSGVVTSRPSPAEIRVHTSFCNISASIYIRCIQIPAYLRRTLWTLYTAIVDRCGRPIQIEPVGGGKLGSREKKRPAKETCAKYLIYSVNYLHCRSCPLLLFLLAVFRLLPLHHVPYLVDDLAVPEVGLHHLL